MNLLNLLSVHSMFQLLYAKVNTCSTKFGEQLVNMQKD